MEEIILSLKEPNEFYDLVLLKSTDNTFKVIFTQSNASGIVINDCYGIKTYIDFDNAIGDFLKGTRIIGYKEGNFDYKKKYIFGE